MSFDQYLKVEAEVAERSRSEYRPEVEAFAQLIEFYERLTDAVTVAERGVSIPAELYLVVMNQLYGAGAQVLRTRASDALAHHGVGHR